MARSVDRKDSTEDPPLGAPWIKRENQNRNQGGGKADKKEEWTKDFYLKE